MAHDFPINTVRRLAEKVGIERISSKALELLAKFAVECVEKITKDSIKLAAHANRMTIKKEDVKLAVRWNYGR